MTNEPLNPGGTDAPSPSDPCDLEHHKPAVPRPALEIVRYRDGFWRCGDAAAVLLGWRGTVFERRTENLAALIDRCMNAGIEVILRAEGPAEGATRRSSRIGLEPDTDVGEGQPEHSPDSPRRPTSHEQCSVGDDDDWELTLIGEISADHRRAS